MDADFPMRVASNYNWAHSLAMDAEVRAKFTSTPDATPFVLHAGEGVDEAAADEVFELDRLNVLDERAILVHGLALGPEGIDLLNARNATLVWCPSSNRHLFSRTHSSKTIAGIRRVLLGSDSPLTAAGDLLDEVRIAHREAGVSARDLYRMLFERAAQVFRLQEGQGTIRPDAAADLIAVRDKGLSPAEIVANLRAADVELVLVGGRVQVASGEVFRRLPPELSRDLRPLEVESTLRWVRGPLGRLFREAHRVLGCDIKLGGKRVRHVCSAWL
jgi:cytosine/adenosine deaminase-related metal-dependent hydrolase